MKHFFRLFALIFVIMVATGITSAQTTPQRTPTDEWAVHVAPGTNPDALAAQMGFINLGQIGSLKGYYLFQAPGITGRVPALTQSLRVAPGVLGAWQQIIRPRYTRATFTDPLYPNQWHLLNTGQNGGTVGEDLNVMGAWDAGFDGTGVVVASVDDGVRHINPDLAPNYRPALSWDFVSNDADPSPSGSNNHGTGVAGVMAGADDGAACGVGVAYNAGISGLRLLGAGTDANEAAALTYKYNDIHVSNNSWGPSDDGSTLEAPGPLTAVALQDGALNGRNGLGTIYTWAAGNGRGSSDDVNADGYANSIYVIAVGASTNQGVVSWYSEYGAPMLINAPSNGGTAGITTSTGNNACRNDFGGTSSAAPATAGVVALMLDANPNLTWRDVKHVLVNTAEKNDPFDSDWTINDAGYDVNHNYGFGRVDATAAVTLAQTWTNVPAMQTSTSPVSTVNMTIPANGSAVTSAINMPDDFVVEHVEIVFSATHPRRGDIEITLTSPNGTVSRMIRRPNDTSSAGFTNWRMSSVRHWGEVAKGNWTLSVYDSNPGNANSGTLTSWQFIVHGYNTAPETFTLQTPSTTLTQLPTSFKWENALAASAYDFSLELAGAEVYAVNDLTRVADADVLSCNYAECTLTLPDTIRYSLSNGDYSWSVTAKNSSSTVPALNNNLAFTLAVPAGVVASKSSATLDEATPATGDSYTVVLNSYPGSDVIVNVAAPSDLTVNPAQLTFTSTNWYQPQTVNLSVVDDLEAEGTETITVTHTATSGDAAYNTLSTGVDVTVIDNDPTPPGVTVSKQTAAVTEGGATDNYTVVLNTQPAAEVTVTLAVPVDLTSSATTLTFTAANWNTAQTVTITAVDDTEVEGAETAIITHSTVSADMGYNGLTVASVNVAITDNDTAAPPELLLNPGFEEKDLAKPKQPAVWVGKGLAKDRLKCNTDTVTFSRSGDCAFRFVGSTLENARLSQNITNVSGLVSGMDLNVSVYYRTNATAPRLKIKSKVFISGQTLPDVTKKMITTASPGVYVQDALKAYKVKNQTITRIKIQFQNRALSGKIYLDDASVTYNTTPR